MERRTRDRRPYRIQVFFWERGVDKRCMGYTVNISDTGMFITTNRLLPKGTRIRAELKSASGASVMMEAVVARAERSMNQLRPDAMGVRFLTTDELVRELIPELELKEAQRLSPVEEGVFHLHFKNRQQFITAYQRDLSTGGLFIPSDRPAPLNEVITVELAVADAPPVRFEARVVHRFEPGGGNLMSGMGVELLNFKTTLEALRQLAAKLENVA